MNSKLSNWAGNFYYSASNIYYPTSLEQVQELVSTNPRIRALGSRHSFSHVADTTGDLISLERVPQEIEIDFENNLVTVSANVRYGQFCQQLYDHGYALHNLASLPHISVAGACATATHGSGDDNGSLASAVEAIEMVAADGNIVKLSRTKNPDEFPGAVVALGGLGVVTRVTLKLLPVFDMQQNLYENLPFEQLVAHYDEIVAGAYSVSFFTDWKDDFINQVWFKSRITPGQPVELPDTLFGAAPAPKKRHPIGDLSPEACTEQMGIAGPWFERMPHFRMEFTPSSGEELQSEFLVPRQHAVAALHEINKLRDRISPLVQTSELRNIAADDYWMSPFYNQPCTGIHFTWVKDWDAVSALLPTIERALAPFNARPHWGKLSTMPGEQVQALYERLPDFQRLLTKYDPDGKFRSEYLDRNVFSDR